MGKIASRWAKTASRCGNIVVRKCQKEREREREREREKERQRRQRQRQRRQRQRLQRQRPTETDRESGGREERERESERETGWQDMCKTALPTSAYTRYTPGRSAPFSRRTLAPGTVRPPSREGCYRDARSPGPRLAQGGVVRPPTD